MATKKNVFEKYIKGARDNYFDTLEATDNAEFKLFGKKINIDTSLSAAEGMSVMASVTAASDALFFDKQSPYFKELNRLISKIYNIINKDEYDEFETIEDFYTVILDKHCDGINTLADALKHCFENNSDGKEIADLAVSAVTPESYDFNKLSALRKELPLFSYFDGFLKAQKAAAKAEAEKSSNDDSSGFGIYDLVSGLGFGLKGKLIAGVADIAMSAFSSSSSNSNKDIVYNEDLTEAFDEEEELIYITELIRLDFMYIFYNMVESVSEAGKLLGGVEDNPAAPVEDVFDCFEKAYKLYAIALAKFMHIDFIPSFKGITKTQKELSHLALMEKVIMIFPYSRYFYDKYFEIGGKESENLISFAAFNMVVLEKAPQGTEKTKKSDINKKESVKTVAESELAKRLAEAELRKKERQEKEAKIKAEEAKKAEEERLIKEEKLRAEREERRIREEKRLKELEEKRKIEEEERRIKYEEEALKKAEEERRLAEERLLKAKEKQIELKAKKEIELEIKSKKEQEEKITKDNNAIHISNMLSNIFDINLIKKYPDLFGALINNELFVKNGPVVYENRNQLVKVIYHYLDVNFKGVLTYISTPSSPKFQKKFKNITAQYGADKVNLSNFILLYDETLSGNGKDGYVLTDTYFCFKNMWEKPEIFPIADIQKIGYGEKCVFINNARVSIAIGKMPRNQMADILIYTICYLLDIANRNQNTSATVSEFVPATSSADKAEDWKCSCGSENAATAKFCSKCGQKRPETESGWLCSSCGTENIAKSKFCMECGKAR